MSGRRAELAGRLTAVRQRMERAADRAGRDPAELTLVVVTKTYPAADVALLADLGVLDVGEARVDEAADKVGELAHAASRLTWHEIGQVQTKKAGKVARWADVVHSVDRARLVEALRRAAEAESRTLQAFVQVSIDGEPGRGGAQMAEVPALADQIAASSRLELLGVMAVAPRRLDPNRAFAALQQASEQLRAAHPDAKYISAGMSGDLEQAIAHGATHLRVGTAVLGSRPPLK